MCVRMRVLMSELGYVEFERHTIEACLLSVFVGRKRRIGWDETGWDDVGGGEVRSLCVSDQCFLDLCV